MDSAEQYERAAQEHREAARESYERCDTDGFVSQWAHGMLESRAVLAAEIARNGGTAVFRALFDLEGTLLPAREVETRFGWAWVIERDGEPPLWFNPSKAVDWVKANRADAAKGFYVGTVRAAARVRLAGGGKGLAGALGVMAVTEPMERDFWRDAVAVDDGTVSVALDVLRARVANTMSRHEEREPGRVWGVVRREFERRMEL